MKIGIYGYGNIGRGVEVLISQHHDMELVGVFTHRNPKEISTYGTDTNVFSVDELDNFTDKIDVLIMCSGSGDLPSLVPEQARKYNTVDSYDTHKKMLWYRDIVNEAAKTGGNVSIIGAGWDPGILSNDRLYAESFLPIGKTYTIWGKGVSQGHTKEAKNVRRSGPGCTVYYSSRGSY